MTDCSNTPTPESTANFNLDSRCFSEVMTSNADYTTSKASDGNVKKTFAAALREAGQEHVGEWSTNPEVTSANQVIPYAGTNQLFRPLSLPYQVDSASHPDPNALLPDPSTGYAGELVDVSKFVDESSIGEFTNYQSNSVTEMTSGLTVGGNYVAQKSGQVWSVIENGLHSSYRITQSTTGIPVTQGLFAEAISSSSPTIKSLIDNYKNFGNGQIVDVVSFWDGWAALRFPIGGGKFVKNEQRSKAAHDGGLFISPTVPFDGTYSGLKDYLDGTGETEPGGSGCWVRLFDGCEVQPEWWGAYGSDQDKSESDSFDSAINSKYDVKLRKAKYTLTRSLKPFGGQAVRGTGNPMRSQMSSGVATVLNFKEDVTAWDTTVNIANGCLLKGVYLNYEAQSASTKEGLKIGIEGTQGGFSQGIRCRVENLVVQGPWFNGAEIAGWAWEVRIEALTIDGFVNRGLKITRAANIISINGLSCISSIGTAKDGYGLSVNGENKTSGDTKSQVYNVGIYDYRSENNRLGAYLEGGAMVVGNNWYLEGNRFGDITVNDPQTFLKLSGLSLIHGNSGNTTTACIVEQSSCDETTIIDVDGITYRVSDGIVNQLYLGKGKASTKLKNINWNGQGLPFGGTNAPKEMSFSENSVTLYRREDDSGQMIGITYDNSEPSSDELFKLTDYDGTERSILYPGSRVINTGTGDMSTLDWAWNSSAWIKRSLTTS